MKQTITTADLFGILDALAPYGSPRVFRVRLWGQRHTSTVVAWSVSDARRRIEEIDPKARVASIVEGAAA